MTASRNYLNHHQYGVSNLSNTAVATVECALPVVCAVGGCPTGPCKVYVYDRSTTANVSCTLRQTNCRGDALWQQTLSSTGGGPGTANPTELHLWNWTTTTRRWDRFLEHAMLIAAQAIGLVQRRHEHLTYTLCNNKRALGLRASFEGVSLAFRTTIARMIPCNWIRDAGRTSSEAIKPAPTE